VVHKPQVVRSLTRRLSMASPGAYSTYRDVIMCLALPLYACDVLCNTCRILYDIVIGCIVVPFYMHLVVDVLLYMTRCAMLS
jgi:hypothetical protein